jgi:ArsR family transcriptional regulator, arsenate/arsenite/antimonite-responsive transcriptional repressor
MEVAHMELDLLTECYKAMGDKTRLKILALLKSGELCVCELVDALEMSQPSISQHLRKLKNAKLVTERRQGQWVFYSLDGTLFPFFSECLASLPDLSGKIEELKAKGLKICCP